MSLTRDQVLAALRTVVDPELFKDIVTLNRVKKLEVHDRNVELIVESTSPDPALADKLEADIKTALMNAGVAGADIQMIAPPRRAAPALAQTPLARRPPVHPTRFRRLGT